MTGRRAERVRLLLSTVWGRPNWRRRSAESKQWERFQTYRNAASICDPTAIVLWRILEETRPQVIVEFGTGFSTFVMAAFAQQESTLFRQSPVIISFEHDDRWFARQQGLLLEAGVSDHVHLVHGAIESRTYYETEAMSYGAVESTLSTLLLEGQADCVFVDGPPARMFGQPGRRGSILQALSLCKMGGTILIHDALRGEEYDVISAFHADKKLPFICRGIVPLWYGLAVCEKSPKVQ